jgi:tRNA threonylcarbamoyl adenosine modification protein YeaZ
VTDFLLALDTATDIPSLALGTARDPGPGLRVPGRRELSRDIEGVAAQLLSARGVGIRDLAGVIVADGPGSFTGLRIGIAFAKGLCRARSLPLFAAPSLLGAAFAASLGSGVVLAEYDALRGDVYRAVYRIAPTGVEVLLPPSVAAAGSPVSLPAGFVRASAAHASAAALLALSGLAGAVSRVGDPAVWEPVYGRPAEAEARYLARQAARGS